MHRWLIVYMDGDTEIIDADDLDGIYNYIERDVRAVVRLD